MLPVVPEDREEVLAGITPPERVVPEVLIGRGVSRGGGGDAGEGGVCITTSPFPPSAEPEEAPGAYAYPGPGAYAGTPTRTPHV